MEKGEEKLPARDAIRERRQAQLSHALTCGLKRFFKISHLYSTTASARARRGWCFRSLYINNKERHRMKDGEEGKKLKADSNE